MASGVHPYCRLVCRNGHRRHASTVYIRRDGRTLSCRVCDRVYKREWDRRNGYLGRRRRAITEAEFQERTEGVEYIMTRRTLNVGSVPIDEGTA